MRRLLLPLVAIDVAANVLLCALGALLTLDLSMLQGSWNQTLSARAGHMQEKKQPYFAWVADAIDALFGKGHCAAQWKREQQYGGVWAAWDAKA